MKMARWLPFVCNLSSCLRLVALKLNEYIIRDGKESSRQVGRAALEKSLLKSKNLPSEPSAGGPQWPKVKQKALKPKQLYGVQMLSVRGVAHHEEEKIVHELFLCSHAIPASHRFQVEGCLTPQEAQRFIETAESIGFQHQGSRGAAYGEASIRVKKTSSHGNDIFFLL